ncbi:hypothetical protein G6F64_015506 [Rhizopus arrhizus]|uniref:Uncharacterized protein n=1 Tax=Rhizopus oryzae TaxID=64495 RepID=A0A9P6WR83_RHIOR|nr:hypothetical protein G6F64_015506 [Rhizopus arrhizus]
MLIAVANTGRQQALERILRRGAQPAAAAAGIDVAGEIGMEAVEVRFGVARHRQDRRLHLQHIALGEEATHQRIE